MKIKLSYSLVLLFISTYLSAEIIISPIAPQSSQDVTISVVNQYGSAASITSEVITRIDNSFVVELIVDVACFLPEAPILTSIFNVGHLQAGEYQVTSLVHNTSSLAGCPADNTISENMTFGVTGPVLVPLGGIYWAILLVMLFTFIAMLHIAQIPILKTR